MSAWSKTLKNRGLKTAKVRANYTSQPLKNQQLWVRNCQNSNFCDPLRYALGLDTGKTAG